MLYVGLPLEFEECVRLLTGELDPDENFSVQDFLKEKGSDLVFVWIDKGVYAFGYELKGGYMETEEMVKHIRHYQEKFDAEMVKLGIDLSVVDIAYIDDAEEPMINVKAMLLQF